MAPVIHIRNILPFPLFDPSSGVYKTTCTVGPLYKVTTERSLSSSSLLRSLFSSRTFIHSHNHSHPHTDCCDWGRIYRHPPAIPFSHASFSKPESDPLARPTTCRVIEWVREYRERGRLNTCERGRLWSLLGWPGFIVTFYHIPAQR